MRMIWVRIKDTRVRVDLGSANDNDCRLVAKLVMRGTEEERQALLNVLEQLRTCP